MRDLPTSLQASLQTGATTLCRCVRLTCADGFVLGLTDHDAELAFDGTVFSPADGFEASQESAALGPATGEWDLQAALTDDRLCQDDLVTGRYDGASVETFLVDWKDPAARLLTSSGTLGDVTSRDGVFQSEVRGPFAAYDRLRGRVFAARCDAELGDKRCGVDIDTPGNSLSAPLLSLPAQNILVFAGTHNVAVDHFTSGMAHFSVGPPVRIRAHTAEDDTTVITLWHAPARQPEIGDAIKLTAGCDKSFECCSTRFVNSANFRGFPDMPGDDFALSYPSSRDGDLDGGSFNP